MAYFETWLTRDLKRPNVLQALKDDFFSQDNKGNRVGVIVTDNGNPVTLTGNVFGYIIRADRATVSLQGTINANKAWIDLPESAYAIVGPLQIVLRQTVGTGTAQTKTTLIACTTYVHRTTTDSFIDPGHVVPSLEELLAQIAVMEQATANANTATNRANTAADNANNKANAANTAANNANTKATAADQAATNANNAAESVKTYNNRLTAVENKFPVKIADGGTGLTASPSMLTNLASTTADNVLKANPRPGVTGTLPIANGGTGMTKNPSMLVNLASVTADTVFKESPRPGVTGTLPIANGGTGATTGPTACENLGAVKKSGDIMTGALRTTALISYNGTWAQVSLRKTADDTVGFSTYFFDVPNSRCGFTVRHPDSTYYNGYLLPAPQVESKTNWYQIVTNKPGGILYYAPGENYEPNTCIFNGMISNSMKTFSFNVRLPRDLHEINAISVTAMKGAIGGINGTIESSTGTTDWLTKSGLTITANQVDNFTVFVQIVSSAAFANATKTLTPAAYYATEFKLAFS